MLKPVNRAGNCEADEDGLLVKILEKSAKKQRTSRRFVAMHAARHASTIARKVFGDGIDLCDPIHPDLNDQDWELDDNSLIQDFLFDDSPDSLNWSASDSPLESEDESDEDAESTCNWTSKVKFSLPEVEVLNKLGGYVITRLKRQRKLTCTGILRN